MSTSPSAAAPTPVLCSTVISAAISSETNLNRAIDKVNDGLCTEIDVSANFTTTIINPIVVHPSIETLRITGTDNTLTGEEGENAGGLNITLSASQNLFISNLNFTDFDNSNSGGAILVSGGDNVTVENSTFSDNTTTPEGGAGGAIYIGGSRSVSIVNSAFIRNSANSSAGKGGAIAISGVGELSIESSTFTNNSADATGGSGGALHLSGTFDTAIIDSTFTLNTADASGGAIDSQVTGTLSITRGSTFDRNEAGNAGGAVHHINAIDSVGSTFTFNKALQGGAVAATVVGPSVGSVTSTDDTFENNEATPHDGGAVWSASTFTGARSHFELNISARWGGALVACPVNDVDSTFRNNSAQDRGGAVYCGAESPSMTHVLNGTHFENNEAFNDDVEGVASGGGAIWTSVALTASHSAWFKQNRSESIGGAVLVNAPSRGGDGATPRNVSLSDTIFESNRAQSGSGGAIQIGGWGPLTISGGPFGGSRFLGNSAMKQGGAIATDDSITASDAIFEGNQSGADSGFAGGAISAGGAVDLTDMSFIDNSATNGSGGAVYTNSTLTDRGSVFKSNSTATSGSGGAVYARGDVSLTGSEFTDNVSVANAGALSVGDSNTPTNVEIEESQFIRNTAMLFGGGVQVFGDLDISDSLFRANEAEQFGGAVSVSSANDSGIPVEGVATISSSTFRENDAQFLGGAIYAPRVTTLASSFIENIAGISGSGAYVGSAADITNSTFYKNSSPDSSEGGALGFDAGVTSATLSFSTIVSDDTGTTPLIFWSGDNTLASTAPIALRGSVLSPGLGRACAWFGTGNMPLASTTSGSFATDGTCISAGVATADTTAFDFSLPLTTDGAPGQQVLIPGSGSILNSYTPSLNIATDQRGSSRPEFGFTSVGAVQVGSTSFSGPQNASASSGSNATFTVSAVPSLGAGATYQWQSSSDGVSWSNITGNASARRATLVLPSVTPAQSGLRLRAKVTTTEDGPAAASRAAMLTVSTSPGPEPSPANTPQPSAVAPERPVTNQPSPQAPGTTGFVINGQVIPVKNESGPRGSGLTLQAGPAEFTLRGQTPNGQRVPLAPDGSLILPRTGEVPISGDGLEPNSTVVVTLFSDPVSLGSAPVGADGRFKVSPVIPVTVPLGAHTLELSGRTKTGEPFVLSVGVLVETPAAALGADPVVSVRPAALKPGASVAVTARGVQAGCRIAFAVAGERAQARASKKGVAQSRITLPQRLPKTVVLRATVSGPGCSAVSVSKEISSRPPAAKKAVSR